MTKKSIFIAAAGAVLVGGCSSKPRNFAPVLSAAPIDEQAYEVQWHSCRAEVAAGTNRKGDYVASAAGGVAAGAGATVVAGAAASGTYATMGGAMAALGATVIAAPIAAIGGAWAISKMKKTKKERAIKAAMADCLAERGYSVADWRVMSKREVRSMAPAASATVAADTRGAPPSPVVDTSPRE